MVYSMTTLLALSIIMLIKTTAMALIGAAPTLLGLASNYGVLGTCVQAATNGLPSCLFDLLTEDGCCSPTCVEGLNAPDASSI